MRYIFLVFMLVAIGSNAQIKPNSFVFGGKVEYNEYNSFYFDINGDYEKIKSVSYSISPEFGWQFNENLSAGISFNVVKEVELDFIIEESYRYGASIFARYQTPLYLKLNIYFQPQIGFCKLGDENSTSIVNVAETDDGQYNFFDSKINIGLLYLISRNFSVELNALNFSYLSRLRIDETDESNYRKFNIGWDLLHPNIGVKIYL